MKYVKDVKTAGVHPQKKCTPDYLRTRRQPEQARSEIHLVLFPANGSLLHHPTHPGWESSRQPTSKPNHRNLLVFHPFHFLACAPPYLCPRGEGKEPQQATLCSEQIPLHTKDVNQKLFVEQWAWPCSWYVSQGPLEVALACVCWIGCRSFVESTTTLYWGLAVLCHQSF